VDAVIENTVASFVVFSGQMFPCPAIDITQVLSRAGRWALYHKTNYGKLDTRSKQQCGNSALGAALILISSKTLRSCDLFSHKKGQIEILRNPFTQVKSQVK
jgi:hypothetical protein